MDSGSVSAVLDMMNGLEEGRERDAEKAGTSEKQLQQHQDSHEM